MAKKNAGSKTRQFEIDSLQNAVESPSRGEQLEFQAALGGRCAAEAPTVMLICSAQTDETRGIRAMLPCKMRIAAIRSCISLNSIAFFRETARCDEVERNPLQSPSRLLPSLWVCYD